MSDAALSGSPPSGYVGAMSIRLRRILSWPLRRWFAFLGHRFGGGQRASAPGRHPLVHMSLCFRCGPVWMTEDAAQPQGIHITSNKPCPAVIMHNWARGAS